jgi:hypothetical protein
MVKGLVTMSADEIDRGDLIRRVLEKRLTQTKAAEALGLGVRQVKRLCRAFKGDGLAGLASKKRGQPSNRRLTAELRARAVGLVLERYHDFGPKLAHEKLLELHNVRSSPGRWPNSNIDIVCASTPQAKGRVERMNKTLQDRLVKELRLQGISTMEGANAFALEFITDLQPAI